MVNHQNIISMDGSLEAYSQGHELSEGYTFQLDCYASNVVNCVCRGRAPTPHYKPGAV